MILWKEAVRVLLRSPSALLPKLSRWFGGGQTRLPDMASFADQLAALQEQEDAAATEVLQRALALVLDPRGARAPWVQEASQVWAALGRGSPEDVARAREAGMDPGEFVTGHGRAGHVFPGPLRASATPAVLAVEWLPLAHHMQRGGGGGGGGRSQDAAAVLERDGKASVSSSSVAAAASHPPVPPPPGAPSHSQAARPGQQLQQQPAGGSLPTAHARLPAHQTADLSSLAVTGVAIRITASAAKPAR